MSLEQAGDRLAATFRQIARQAAPPAPAPLTATVTGTSPLQATVQADRPYPIPPTLIDAGPLCQAGPGGAWRGLREGDRIVLLPAGGRYLALWRTIMED